MTNKQANTEIALQNLYTLRAEYTDGEQEYLDMIEQIKNTLSQPANKMMLDALKQCKDALIYLNNMRHADNADFPQIPDRTNNRFEEVEKKFGLTYFDCKLIDEAIAVASAPVVEVEIVDGLEHSLNVLGHEYHSTWLPVIEAAREHLKRQKGR